MQPSQFVLHNDIKDEEWESLIVMSWKSFEFQPEIAIVTPGGLDPAHRTANVSLFKEGMSGGPIERVNAIIKYEVSGDIVSYMACRVYRGSLGFIDGDAPPSYRLPQVEDDKDREFYEWFLNSNRAIMRELKELQVPLLYIQRLGTDPAWQRQGAATILLNWAFEFVVNAGLGRCALMASPFAVKTGIYQKFGFRVIHDHTYVDEELFPGKQGVTVVIMVKDF